MHRNVSFWQWIISRCLISPTHILRGKYGIPIADIVENGFSYESGYWKRLAAAGCGSSNMVSFGDYIIAWFGDIAHPR